jgi:hypothetical protein
MTRELAESWLGSFDLNGNKPNLFDQFLPKKLNRGEFLNELYKL